MSSNQIIGIVLLIIGVIMLTIGMNSSHSPADQISETFLGRFTDTTNLYLIGGAAIALLGLLMSIFGMRGKPG